MSETQRKAGNAGRGAGCLRLFALPFAAVGIIAAYLVFSDLWDWHRMRNWVETPARIVSAELVESHGEDATTYRVEARYETWLDGVTYTGNRVGLSGQGDNIGTFHQDVYWELTHYRDAGQSFRCFVDPGHPAEAFLYRELRLGLLGFKSIFAILSGGVGFGLMAAARYGKRKLASGNKLKQRYPDQP